MARNFRKYYLLAERDSAGEPWFVSFGDYDRECVHFERQCRRDHGVKATDLKVMSVIRGRQGCIDRAMDTLNGDEAVEAASRLSHAALLEAAREAVAMGNC